MQKWLDGKKKYTALILTLAAAIVPVLVQDPETQKTVMDAVPSVVALFAGIVYIMTQGGIDREKEITAREVSIANGNGNGAAKATTATPPAAPDSEALEALPPKKEYEQTDTLDLKAFHQAVLDEVAATYKETNPATVYYKARDRGTVTTCTSDNDLVTYWNYLVDLAVDARDWLKEQTEKKKGECGRSPEYYVFTRDFNSTIRIANAVTMYVDYKASWKKWLQPFQWKLYTIGVLINGRL